jgi:hypothetical protein
MIVLFAGRHPAITDQFMRRFARTLERHGIAIRDRIRVLPPVAHDDYMRVNLSAMRWWMRCALVRGQHQPRCAGLRSARRDFARDRHAWPTERRNAVAAWCAGTDRQRSRRLYRPGLALDHRF